MNTQNIDKLIDALRAEEIATFSLSTWNGPKVDEETGAICGTVACIAGFAALLNTNFIKIGDNDYYRHVEQVELISRLQEVAKYYLGIDQEMANALFLPPIDALYDDVTVAEAIKVLEHLRDTGKVDWTIVGYEYDQDSKIRNFGFEWIS